MRIAGIWDYYPFGMQMPGRVMASGAYRYGFQGQEEDDEIKTHYSKGNNQRSVNLLVSVCSNILPYISSIVVSA